MNKLILTKIEKLLDNGLKDANAFIAAAHIADIALEVMEQKRECCRRNVDCTGDFEVCFAEAVQCHAYDEIMWRFGQGDLE